MLYLDAARPRIYKQTFIYYRAGGWLSNGVTVDRCRVGGCDGRRLTQVDTAIQRDLLRACAAICHTCGQECETHAQMHEHCRLCVETCRQCEQVCSELARTL